MELTINLEKVFVVIPTYNGLGIIEQCIKSLINSRYQCEIIVIDNASTDETVKYLQSIEIEYCILNKRNLGFGAANNIGIELALDHGADYVLLLNQDTIVENDTIEKLVDFAARNPDVGLVSPIHLNHDGSSFDRKFSSVFINNAPEFLDDLYLKKSKNFYNSKFINAAAWLLSRQCIETVGGFDPLFFVYGEDEEYCYRIRHHGLKIGYLTDARIYHSRTKVWIKDKANLRDWWINNLMVSHHRYGYHVANLIHQERFLQVFLVHLLDSIFNILKNVVMLQSSIVTGKFFGEIIATIRVVLQIFKIYFHRKKCMTEKGIWINNKISVQKKGEVKYKEGKSYL